jgi:CRISPR-associated protein Cas1
MTQIQTLIVDQYGAYVGRHSERICVTQKRKVLVEAPVLFLEQILIIGDGVSVSTDAIALCSGQGIPIHYVSRSGTPYASLYAAGLGGTVVTRRAQYEAYHDRRGVELAVAFVGGKIQNQARLLKYLGKSRKEKTPQLHEQLRQAAKETAAHLGELHGWHEAAVREGLEPQRGALLSIEGRAAQRYWAGIGLVLPETLKWPGRVRRGARDPFNAALNYGYAILYSQIERAILLAGLDSYAGYIHSDRPGKPSLVLDMIEEFRAPVVDRAIAAMVGLGEALEQDREGLLTLPTRRAIADRIIKRLEESTERYESKRQKLRWILQSQARHLASFLRGDRPEYPLFLSGW